MDERPKRLSPLRRLLSPTNGLTRQGRARRRFNCGQQAEWDERAETAIHLLTANRDQWERRVQSPLAVADFGAGNERMRPLLAQQLDSPHSYSPYDLHPQRRPTKRLDVSQEMPDRDFDIVICLGLLEYLPSVRDFATALHGCCRIALVSYVPLDNPVGIPRQQRLEQGWTTHQSGGELEAGFNAAGFTALATAASDGRATTLWLWAAEDRC